MKRLLRAFLGTCCFMGISLGTDAGKEDETPPFVSLKATAIYAKSHIPSIQRTAKHDYIKTYEQLVEGGGSLLDEEDHTLYQRLKKDQTAQDRKSVV